MTEKNDHHTGTHAGGIGIHLIPSGFGPRIHTISIGAKFQQDPLNTILNPRKFLARNHLHLLREMFPTSLGARVFVSGLIVLLFKDRAAIEKTWQQDGELDVFGNLRVRYDILNNTPTQNKICSGTPISPANSSKTYAALGLKLRFPQGYEAITVPTHAFVDLKPASLTPVLRIINCYLEIKKKLARFASIHSISMPAIGFTRGESNANSPLGKMVCLAYNSQQVCVICSISICYMPTKVCILDRDNYSYLRSHREWASFLPTRFFA